MQELSLNPSSMAYFFYPELIDAVPAYKKNKWGSKESLAIYTALVALQEQANINISLINKKVLPGKHVFIVYNSKEWASGGLEQIISQSLSSCGQDKVKNLSQKILQENMGYRFFVQTKVQEELMLKGLLLKEVSQRPLIGSRVSIRENLKDKTLLRRKLPLLQVMLEQFASQEPELAKLLAKDVAKSLMPPVAAGLFT